MPPTLETWIIAITVRFIYKNHSTDPFSPTINTDTALGVSQKHDHIRFYSCTSLLGHFSHCSDSRQFSLAQGIAFPLQQAQVLFITWFLTEGGNIRIYWICDFCCGLYYQEAKPCKIVLIRCLNIFFIFGAWIVSSYLPFL